MPCSIDSMPASTAFLMPCVACACDMTVLPAAWASYTIAAISSGENPVAVGSSFGDITPPDVMVLMTSAPARSISRVARRTSSTPSTTPFGRSGSPVQVFTPDGIRESPCPPVCDSAPTAIRIRGPGKSPRSTASFTPRVVMPASRTVVKPASSVVAAFFRAIATPRLGGVRRRCSMFHWLAARWTWQSMSPGRIVSSPVSITSTPFGGSAAMRWMTPSSMTMNRSAGRRSRGARSSRDRTAP